MSGALLRLVIDTNVLVSAALLPEGGVRRYDAVRRCVEIARRNRLLASEATLAELRAVLMRPDFDRYKGREERLAFLAGIEAEVLRVEPADAAGLCSDPEDDMFLGVALAGRADFLVTHDQALLSVRSVGGTRILRPQAFVALAA